MLYFNTSYVCVVLLQHVFRGTFAFKGLKKLTFYTYPLRAPVLGRLYYTVSDIQWSKKTEAKVRDGI